MTDLTRPHIDADLERHLTVHRTARYVVLGGEGDVKDVWVCVHGFGQLARRFARDLGALVSPRRKIVVPEALNRYYIESLGVAPQDRKVGATWMTKEDRDADIADYVAYLDALYGVEVAPHAVMGAKVTVLGFSQGVTTVVRWAVLGLSHIDRLVCWAGALPHDIDLAQHAAKLRAMSPVMAIGDADEFGDWAAVEEQRARFDAAGIPHTVHQFAGGHVLNDDVLQRIANG